jgi:outer membrane protein OmpA-like peptidoglycan-associated protein
MNPLKPALIIMLFVCGFCVGASSAADVKGGKDHPLLKRYEGSSLLWYEQKNYDALKMALECIVFDYGEGKMKPFKKLEVEGRKTTLFYNLPAGAGTLEGVRQYENELKEKGFEILFRASGDEVEKNKGDNLAMEVYGMTSENTNRDHPQIMAMQGVDKTKSHYLATRLARPEGDVFCSVWSFEASWTAATLKAPEKSTVVRVDICEVKPMEQKMVLVKAEEMAGQIALNGKVALYGILFDTDKATIRPDSEATLAEITKLLQDKPDLRVLVVGHTDTEGSFEYNRSLSQRRADSVVSNLTEKGISKERLFPVGISFASPVATNATEEGRAKNRRVELVDMGAAKAK